MTLHRTFLNWKETGADIPYSSDQDLTEPNMTKSLKELIQEQNAGKDVPIFQGEYEDDMPDIKGLDMVELKDIAKSNLTNINNLQIKLQEQEDAKINQLIEEKVKQRTPKPKEVEGDEEV